MDLDLSVLQQHFPGLLKPAVNGNNDTKVYGLNLPDFQVGRDFAWAELRLPKGFPKYSRARVYLSPDAILRIPHVEWDGALCIEEDPGPSSGLSENQRIVHLLNNFQENFLHKWITGELDGDFVKEALNYWSIAVERNLSKTDPIRTVWTVDLCPEKPMLRRGTLLLPGRIVIAAEDQIPITNRLISTLGPSAKQRVGVLVADIPISYTLTPQTWPNTTSDLNNILYCHLPPRDYHFLSGAVSRRDRSIHRIVLLRNSDCSFAYLLPGGPSTVVDTGNFKKSYPPRLTAQPLNVVRLDPAWTVGRDMHPEVESRQRKHILVIGAGSLGSPVIDLLAKAGVGNITVIDPEVLEPQNIGRHLLGAESIGQRKVTALSKHTNASYPGTIVKPQCMKAEAWLKKHTLNGIDAVLDLTGEPDVRWQIDQAREQHPCPLLIGWMEPYVAAAHACVLPAGTKWFQGNKDLLTSLEAITWPAEVIRKVPGCSSRFQSYTATAAAHAVALIAEQAIELIDGATFITKAQIVSWVRGERYLDQHCPGICLKQWAKDASAHDGLIMKREFP